MYVDPFWFGVIVTVVTELLALVVYAFVLTNRSKKNEKH